MEGERGGFVEVWEGGGGGGGGEQGGGGGRGRRGMVVGDKLRL